MSSLDPHRRNKIDVSQLPKADQDAFRKYGKLPSKSDLLQNKLKERKYFDSGDYALSKAGKASDVGVTSIGREHPVPENIPHSSNQHAQNGVFSPGAQPHPGLSGSPVKESGLQRETSADDEEDAKKKEAEKVEDKENALES